MLKRGHMLLFSPSCLVSSNPKAKMQTFSYSPLSSLAASAPFLAGFPTNGLALTLDA